MASTLCYTLNELHTSSSSCKRKQFFRDGFVVKVRNLGICQLGFSQIGGTKRKLLSTSPRNFFSVRATEGLVSVVEEEEEDSFTVSYLINSCGLTPQLAISASKKVKFSTSDKPDLVLSVLRKYGFKSTHIAKLVSKAPSLLLARPEITFIPKLEFFRSMGFSDGEIVKNCSSGPSMFRYSLKNRIIPICDFLKSVLLDHGRVRCALRAGGCRIFESDVQQFSVPKVTILKQMGATPAVISYMLIICPAIFNQDNGRFEAGVEEVIRLGFNPSRLSFMQALSATTMMGKSKWEKKVRAYKSWGCSDDDIAIAFRKYPICMLVSEKKISQVMDFLVNELGLELSDVMRNPYVFAYSMKKRIIPRCSVVRVLQLKGLLKEDWSIVTAIIPPESHFLEKFVIKYEKHVPQLLSLYQGELGLRELLGFGPEDNKVGLPKCNLFNLVTKQEMSS